MPDNQRAIWTMTYIVSSSFNLVMQGLTANSYTTGAQHKELSIPRMSIDNANLVMFGANLGRFTSFADDKSLHFIITGVTALLFQRFLQVISR